MRPRRAFTMLEMVLAMAVASVVLIGAFGIFTALNRSNALLQDRLFSTFDLERTRRAFHSSFLHIVSSPRASRNTGANANNRAQPVPPDGGASKSGDKSSGKVTDPLGQPEEPPRLILGTDTSSRVSGFLAAAHIDAHIPRLELVLSRSPVAVKARLEDAPILDEDRDRPDTTSQGGRQAIRGAFELLPQFGAPRGRTSTPEGQVVWELWWTPLPPPPENPGDPPLPMSLAAGRPVKLCGDLVSCSIRFRKEPKEDNPSEEARWTSEFQATSTQDLPAYANVKLEFADGVKCDWIFEIDYSTGSEVALNKEEQDEALKEAGGVNNAGNGRGSSTGVPYRGGGVRSLPPGVK